MKLLLIIGFVCICLECVSSKQQEEQNSEDQIRKLQAQVRHIHHYLKKIYDVSLPMLWKFHYTDASTEISYLLNYLRGQGRNDSDVEAYADTFYKIKGISPEAFQDFSELFSNSFNKVNTGCISALRFKLKLWKTANVVLNVTYVQEKQKQLIDYYGQQEYKFLREDYRQCLDMFAEDLSKNLPSDTVSRLISLHGIVHGNRTEIETALSYLYGSSIGPSTNAVDVTTPTSSLFK